MTPPMPPTDGSGSGWSALVGILIIVLLLAAGGAYFFFMQPQTPSTPGENADTTQTQDSTDAIGADLEATHDQSLEGDVNALEGAF